MQATEYNTPLKPSTAMYTINDDLDINDEVMRTQQHVNEVKEVERHKGIWMRTEYDIVSE